MKEEQITELILLAFVKKFIVIVETYQSIKWGEHDLIYKHPYAKETIESSIKNKKNLLTFVRGGSVNFLFSDDQYEEAKSFLDSKDSARELAFLVENGLVKIG